MKILVFSSIITGLLVISVCSVITAINSSHTSVIEIKDNKITIFNIGAGELKITREGFEAIVGTTEANKEK